jgi:hypothetical protein
MGKAVCSRACLTSAGLGRGEQDKMRAAIPAACAAAADVPPNGFKGPFGSVVDTPVAAVTSGFGRILPPFEEKLPGVIGAPAVS